MDLYPRTKIHVTGGGLAFSFRSPFRQKRKTFLQSDVRTLERERDKGETRRNEGRPIYFQGIRSAESRGWFDEKKKEVEGWGRNENAVNGVGRRFNATQAEIKTSVARIYRSVNALRESTIKRTVENTSRGPRAGRIVRPMITPTTFISDTAPLLLVAYFRWPRTPAKPIHGHLFVPLRVL